VPVVNIHRDRPACYQHIGPLTARGEVCEGWADGIVPGMRNPFADLGVPCGNARTPELWREHLALTPGCAGCCRGRADQSTTETETPMANDLDTHRPAEKWSDLQATFHRFDFERFRYLAAYLREGGKHDIAELADKWAAEHLQVARQLARGR
jgi:hypothetical protein